MELYIELSLAEFDSLLLNNSISDNSILSSAAGSRQLPTYLAGGAVGRGTRLPTFRGTP